MQFAHIVGRAISGAIVGLVVATAAGCGASVDAEASTSSAIELPDQVHVSWLGTAGLYVTDGTTSFLVDPFVTRYRLARIATRLPLPSDPALVSEWVRKLDMPARTPVVVTHSHYDHALDAPNFVTALGSRLIGSDSTMNVGLGAGLRRESLQQVRGGDSVDIGAFTIRFLDSCHGPQIAGLEVWTGDIDEPLEQPTGAHNYKVGEHFSLYIEHPRARFVHQASACVMPRVYDGIRADTVFLGIPQRPSTLAIVDPLVRMGATAVYPIHWDGLFRPLSDGASPMAGVDLPEFLSTVSRNRRTVRARALDYAETVTLPLPRD